jgi:hypothetical protein
MKLRFLIPLLMIPSAYAAPHLYGNVEPGVTSCGMVLDGAPKVVMPVVAGQCKFDLANVSNGSHTVTLTAIAENDPVWGTQESAPSAPFVFVRPAAPTAPSTVKIAP